MSFRQEVVLVSFRWFLGRIWASTHSAAATLNCGFYQSDILLSPSEHIVPPNSIVLSCVILDCTVEVDDAFM